MSLQLILFLGQAIRSSTWCVDMRVMRMFRILVIMVVLLLLESLEQEVFSQLSKQMESEDVYIAVRRCNETFGSNGRFIFVLHILASYAF